MTSKPRLIWSWLHLSDLHYGHGDARWKADQDDVFAQLIADLRASMPVNVGGVLVTGDIAFSGGALHPTEYDAAEALVNDVLGAVGAVPVFVVAGNHDVQRTRGTTGPAPRLLESLRAGRDRLDSVLADSDDQQVLAARFANYTAFTARVGAPHGTDADGAWERTVVDDDGIRVRLVGLNTALLSNDDSDEGRLAVGVGPVNRLLRHHDANEVVILLTHHPINDLNEDDSANLRSKAFGRVDIHLHGHVHGAENIRAAKGSKESLITLTAGALHADEDRGPVQTTHHYSFGALWEADGKRWIEVWPRFWSIGRARWVPNVELTDGGESFRLPLSDDFQPPGDSGATSLVRRVGDASMASALHRRTAFPTDLSLGELFERDLVIPPTLTWAAGGPATSDDVAAACEHGNVLILGEPGAGKTVAVLRAAEASPLPTLLVDPSRLTTDTPTLADALTSIDPDWTQLVALGAGDEERALIVLDGVDEALARGLPVDSLVSRIAHLGKIGPMLISCRQDEYTRMVAAVLPTNTFYRIATAGRWRADVEFTEYVNRLVGAELLPDNRLLDRVATDEALSRLAERPLHARMLTFLADTDLPLSEAALYEAYVARLGLTTDARLQGLTLKNDLSSAEAWRQIAWAMFRTEHRSLTFALSDLIKHGKRLGMGVETVVQCLAGIADVSTLDQRVAFLHYSFFEFLVASQFAAIVRDHGTATPALVAEAATVDFPIEVRRYAVKQLERLELPAAELSRELVAAFDAASALPLAQALVAKNLLVYLMCRVDEGSQAQLLELIEQEGELFVRNSIWWALARTGHEPSALRYLQELEASTTFSDLNRGYLLYYYGDIRTSTPPPYHDNSPHVEWKHTLAALTEKYDGGDYADVPAARTAIDLYTFADLHRVRGEAPSPRAANAMRRLAVTLEASMLDADVVARATAPMHAMLPST